MTHNRDHETVSAEIAMEEVCLSLEDLLRHERRLRSLDPAMAGHVFLHARRLLSSLEGAGKRMQRETISPPQDWDGRPGKSVLRWAGPGGAGLMVQDDGGIWRRQVGGGPWVRVGTRPDSAGWCVDDVPGGPWRLIQGEHFYSGAEKS